MILAAPAVRPVTIPAELTAAVPGWVLLHVPPGVGSLKTVLNPAQMEVLPMMAAGNGLTTMLRAL